MAICRGIIEAHGGRIWVEDRSGGGSTFQIALPLPAGDPIGYEIDDNQAINVTVGEAWEQRLNERPAALHPHPQV